MTLILTPDHFIGDKIAGPLAEVLASLVQAIFTPLFEHPGFAVVVLFAIIHNQIPQFSEGLWPDHDRLHSKRKGFRRRF